MSTILRTYTGGVEVLPVIDRIFTRIGASDNLARGRSTFMVEMTETAVILNTARRRWARVVDCVPSIWARLKAETDTPIGNPTGYEKNLRIHTRSEI